MYFLSLKQAPDTRVEVTANQLTSIRGNTAETMGLLLPRASADSVPPPPLERDTPQH